MQKRQPFGDYLPDLPGLSHPGLTIAKNSVPRAGGYGQQLGPVALTGFSALADTARGQLAMIDAGGNPHHFSGDATSLYHLSASTEDVTRASGIYNANGDARWEFALFGDTIIAVNPFDDPQYFTIPTSVKFDRLSTGAPSAYHMGLIGRHIVLGRTNDPIDGPVGNRVWWPAIGDPFNWPVIGSDNAVAVQSDFNNLEGEGGNVQRVVSGAEVGAVFQERAIWRMDYVGSPAIYQFSRVEPSRGLLIPGSVVTVGRNIFYCGEDGFYAFDYTTSVNIGKEQIDQTFLSDVDSQYFHRVTALRDPDQTRFFVLYPGQGNVAGLPNKWLCYDWALRRWSHGEFDGQILAHVLQVGLTLDHVPDTLASGIDDAAIINPTDGSAEPLLFDDPLAGTGALQLGIYDSSNQLASLTGTPLEAVFETGDLEILPGRHALLDLIRPLVTGTHTKLTVQSAGRNKYQAPIEYGKGRTIDLEGDAGVRMSGRYHRIRTTIKNGFDEALGSDLQYGQGGIR